MNNYIDPSNYLIHRFSAELKGNDWQMNCPFCSDEKQHFGINLHKKVVNCFKCGYKNRFVNFVSEYENISIGKVFSLFQEYATEIDHKTPSFTCISQFSGTFSINQYKSLTELNKVPYSLLFRKAVKYLRLRHISLRDANFWKLGLSNDERYVGRIIIPFFENNKLVYFVARKFIKLSGPKYINPPKEETGIGKSHLLYNYDNAKKFKTVIICEGVFDVFAVGKNAIAIMGKDLSDYQLQKICSMKCKKVQILLDSGTEKESNEIAVKLEAIKKVEIIKLKKGDPSSERSSLWEETAKNSFNFADSIKSALSSKKMK